MTKTSAYTAVKGDVVLANAAGGAFSVTLPTPAAGAVVEVVKSDATINPVTVVGTINGATNSVISSQWVSRRYVSNGTSWVVAGDYTPASVGTIPAVAGTTLYAFGHSIPQGTGATVVNFGNGLPYDINATGWNNYPGWITRLAHLCQYGTIANYARGGAYMADLSVDVLNTKNFGQGQAYYGTYILQGLTNNVAGHPYSTAERLSISNSLKAMIHVIRANTNGGASALATAAAFVYTGTWTTVSSDGVSLGGTTRKTTTQNDSVVITITTDTAVILLRGYDDAQAGVTGAAYSYAVSGGGASGTGTTSNVHVKTGLNLTSCPVPIVLTGTGATTGSPKTVTITKTDATGSQLAVNALLSYTAATFSPPTILVVKDAPPSGFTAANQATYISDIDAIVAAFPSTEVMSLDVDALSPGNFANGTYTIDGTHWNDYGHTFVAQAAAALLTPLTYRKGQNRL